MSGDPAQMHPLTLSFADAELEAAFVEEQARKAQRLLRLVALWAGGILLVTWALMGVTFPQVPHVHARVAAPMSVMLGVLALGYVLSGGTRFLRFHQHILTAGMCVMPAAIIGWIAVMPRALILSAGIPILILHTYNVYTLVRLRFPAAVACAWLSALMFIGYVHAIGVLAAGDFGGVAILLCAVNAFGMLGGYQMELYARREFVAMRELKRVETQLRVARDQAVAATLAKSQFLANMSHELRTPLNAINGFSEVLLERMFGELNEKQEDYLKDIHSSGKHLLSLINDILDLSKVEAGRMELDVTSFNVPAAIENALALVRERAVRHGIALECSIDALPAEFSGDERKFKQIMLNLLSNAIKFTPEGGKIAVTARMEGGLLEMAVSDTGAGIAGDDLPLMFQEFRQVGTDQVRKAEGTGLGLALSKRFCELHGGSIRVDSALGKGSTFTFTFAEQGLSGTNR